MKKIIALILKVLLAAIVLIFLGSESIAFFTFVFPPEKWFMAYTGFGLTSGALLVYLYLFLYDADTDLKRVVALIMMGAGVLGELATAGFGMQVEAWSKSGYVMTESDFDFMVLAVQILMLAHAVALLAYWAGDSIADAFKKDVNKDGIPDIFQPKINNSKPAPFPINRNESSVDTRDLEIIELRRKLAELNPQTGQEQK
jgi:hypothetical protein